MESKHVMYQKEKKQRNMVDHHVDAGFISLPADFGLRGDDLEFNENTFIANQFTTTKGGGDGSSSSSSPTETKTTRRRSFVDYVQNYVLSNKSKKIDKFHLSLSDPQEFASEVEGWLRYVIANGVKDLELDFSDVEWNNIYHVPNHIIKPVFTLPDFFYDYGMFNSLKLFGLNVKVSRLANLISLKNLSLGGIEFTSSSLKTLISQCMSLESLTLKKCKILDYSLDISTPSGANLLSLDIEDCGFGTYTRISVPTLKSFKISGSVQTYDLENLSGLEEAELNFWQHNDFEDGYGNILCNQIFGPLGCIKALTVCNFVTQVISCGDESVQLKPKLYGVKHLTLKTGLHSNELRGIAFLLNSCPRLEKLSLEMETPTSLEGNDDAYNIINSRYFWRLECTPKCLGKKLKEVEVVGYKGYENEMQLLTYLLKQCRCLKMMTIFPSKESEDFERSAQMLLAVQRASRKVLIQIC